MMPAFGPTIRFRLTAALAALMLAPAGSAAWAAGSSTNADRSDQYFKDALGDVEDGDYADAIERLEKVVAKQPGNADAHNLLGYSYRKLGDYERALEHYTHALDLDPDHIGAHEYIGEAYAETGDLAKAEEHLAALARLCPSGCAEYDALAAAIAAARTGE